MQVSTPTLTVIGLYMKRVSNQPGVAVPQLEFRPGHGVVGELNAGAMLMTGAGELIPNVRHFTAVSPFELGEIAAALKIPFLDPAWLSANICFDGLDRLTKVLVAGTRLLNAEGQAVLEVKDETDPCLKMGQRLASLHPLHEIQPQYFPKYAYGLRGVYGIALEPTVIRLYDTLTVVLPADVGEDGVEDHE